MITPGAEIKVGCEFRAGAEHFPDVTIEPGADAVDHFSALFESLAPRVYAYARRHVGAEGAEDVVSETFLVAWRRRGELPDELLPWLLVVARKTIANRRRSDARRARLHAAAAEFAQLCTSVTPAAEETAAARAATVAALAALTDLEREALLLVAWDGLAPPDAASVAGCSRRAFEVRLSRARARLSRALARSDEHPDRPPRTRPNAPLATTRSH